ncbi:MAG TPA: hypothetical protein VHY84_27525 [Bryobacteraceae bacterium]|jgi:hypothetical protein|nr:hypothetical protein [Bryobacteraceae bacterium]
MPTTQIPRSALELKPGARRCATYAQLIRNVNRHGPIPFDGRFFKTGSRVEESDLRPDPEWPETPLLIEYAGNDRSGRGHRRANDIHVLWKFEHHEWIEIDRITSQGPEWWHHLQPAVLRELAAPLVNLAELAGKATDRILDMLDRELDVLEDDGRKRVMSFLYDQFTARMTNLAA